MFRHLRDTDKPFVAHSWASSFFHSHWAGPWTENEYWSIMRPKLDGILANPEMKVLLSCNPGDDDQLFGFACYTPADVPILHFVYVKHAFRDHKDADEKPRIAIKLLRELGMADGKRFQFTFRTRAWDKFSLTWRLNGKFAPEIIKGRGPREDK